MKKIVLLFCITALAACSTIKLSTETSPPKFWYANGKLCASQNFSASVNQDSVFVVFSKGVIIGKDDATLKISYADALLLIEPKICFRHQDFCLTGKLTFPVPQDSLLAVLKKGISLGNDTNNVKLNYLNGNLTAQAQGCFKLP